jgi:hypothetical protein
MSIDNIFREARAACLPVPADLHHFQLSEALNLAQIAVGMSPLILFSFNKTPRKGIMKVPWVQVIALHSPAALSVTHSKQSMSLLLETQNLLCSMSWRNPYG